MKIGIFNLTFLINLSVTLGEYWSDRKQLIEDDRKYAVGANIVLTNREKIVNDILMNYKLSEFEQGFDDPSKFLAVQHFFKSKKFIEKSEVFKIIKHLPKGAALHAHDEAIVSQEFLYNLTFRDNLYGCIDGEDLTLQFFDKANISDNCNWTLISTLRKSNSNFDNFLRTKLTIIRDDPQKSYPNINVVWLAFQHIFKTISKLLTFKPVFEDFFYEALKELYADNVKYFEFRGNTPELYDLEGNTYSELDAVRIYADVLKKFKIDYPDFYGAKFIYGPNRRVNNATMKQYVNNYRDMKNGFPDFVTGFDLVGQEDLGHPLSFYIPQLLEIRDIGANFFFHAGETNWNGESTDFNLFDAILLNTTRIGHGYALLKHPALAKIVKQRKIAIEICPISNQVLKLVTDLRNHPGAIMIANGFPVVIASDDPGFWGAKALSYDWYVAYMAMTSKNTDLRFLKQLAMDSLLYSSLNEHDKHCAILQWNKDWNLFIDKMLQKYHFEMRNEVSLDLQKPIVMNKL